MCNVILNNFVTFSSLISIWDVFAFSYHNTCVQLMEFLKRGKESDEKLKHIKV